MKISLQYLHEFCCSQSVNKKILDLALCIQYISKLFIGQKQQAYKTLRALYMLNRVYIINGNKKLLSFVIN